MLKPALTTIPPQLQSIADYEYIAKEYLADDVWQYLIGGAMDESSLKQNRIQFEQIKLLPRPLQDLSQGNTLCTIFGQQFPHPIFLAPIGHQALFHPEAEQATALAAEAMQANFILSNFCTTPMQQIHTPFKWFQLYWQGNREHILNLVRQAEQSNYQALVITVDAAHAGIRDRERRIFFNIPNHLQHPHLDPNVSIPKLSEQQHPLFDSLMALAPKWSDIAWLASQTHLPIILKGILHPQDALLAIEHGAKGIIVSNHGGRILDTVVSPLDVLPAIRSIVPKDFPLLLDSGIRRGTDIFKAIALGANAILIGRPYIYGLATAGALGVAHVIRILKEELEITMALMGKAGLDQIQQQDVLGWE